MAQRVRRLASGWLALVCLIGACAGAHKRTLDEAFRRIQVHEAAIAAGEAKLTRSEKQLLGEESGPVQRPTPEDAKPTEGDQPAARAAPCASAKRLAEEGICKQAKALCDIAHQLDDTDALHRCLIGSDTCRSAQVRAQAICTHPAAPAPP